MDDTTAVYPTVEDLPSRRWLFVAVAFFLVSGACGLLYQVVWTRKLVLLFGTTSYAVSTVLSVFFLGLALGSLVGGRIADRTRRPLWIYGLMEVIVGIWALLFIVLIDSGESLIVFVLRMAGGGHGAGIALRSLLATAFLLVPVTLMGATLPLLSRFVTARGPVLGRRIGTLYSLNTVGAVLGCAITGFVLIAALGYTATTYVGASLNITIGLLAMAASRRAETPTRDALDRRVDTGPKRRRERIPWDSRVVLAAFAVSGFSFLALEVLWTRLLTIVFLGTTYAFTTMLTAVLCGIALGSAVASFMADRVRNRAMAFGTIQLLTSAACLAMLYLFPALPERLQAMKLDGGYEWTAIVRAKFFLSFSVLFVPTFLFGMSFPFALKAYTETSNRVGRRVGRLYAANTFGGVLGALVGGYLLIPLLGTHRGIVAVSWLMAYSGLFLTLSAPRVSINRRVSWATIGVASVLVAMTFVPRDVSISLNRSFLPVDHEMIHFSEGVEGTVVVSAPRDDPGGSNRVLWINAVQATASIEKGVKMNRFQAMLPFVFDREIDNALFMCFGSGITAGTLSMGPLQRIDAVEISPDVLDAAPLFRVDNFDVTENPKFHPTIDDGRNYLLRTRKRYDLITFEPMPLALAGVSTFYTREYYELCKARLTDSGLVSQWVPLHNGLDVDTIRTLLRTFVDVFPESTAWFINADIFLIGSREPLTIDYDRFAERYYANEELRAGLEAVYLPDPIEILAGFLMDKHELAAFVGQGEVMTDDHPWAEFIAPKAIYTGDVAEVLAALQPHRSSVANLVRFPGGDEGATIRTALHRRYRAHLNDMEGLKLYYGSGPFSSPEDVFRQSLEIDPDDANARYYIVEALFARGSMFTQWDKLDQAIPMLEEAAHWAPRRSDLYLALGNAYDKAGRAQDAQSAYEHYVALGGASARETDGAPITSAGAVSD